MTIASAGRAARTRAVYFVALALLLASLGAVPGCDKGKNDDLPGGTNVSIQLQSPAFQEGETIPKQYTGDGKDTSPPLRWSAPPEGAKSFALICDDPDAPKG